MTKKIEDHRPGERFVTSLGFLVTVLASLFGLLFVFAPRYERLTQLTVQDRKAEEGSPTSRRQKLRTQGAKLSQSSGPREVPAAVSAKPVRPKDDRLNVGGEADIEKKLASAVELIDSGNPRDAQSLLEEILKVDPKNEQALVELGMIHLIDYHSAGAALPYLEDALRVNASNKIVLSELVGVYEELGQAEQGLGFLTQVYAEHPENGGLSYGIGQILVGQGREADALAYLESAAESGDSDAEYALTDLADAYSAAGFPDKSLATFRRAIEQERLRLQTSPGNKGEATDADYGEDRLTSLEMDYTRELIRQGRLDEADEQLKRISSRIPADEGVAALTEQINRKRNM